MLGGGQLLPELAVEPRADARDLARLPHAARGVDAEARVVERQHPADRLHPRVLRHARVRDDAQRRQHRLADPVQHGAVGQAPVGDRLHAPVGQLPGHLGHEAHRRGELRAAEGAVQDRDVERVHQVLVVLEPVARDDRRARPRPRCCRRPPGTRPARASRGPRSAAARACARAGPCRRRSVRSAPAPDTRAGASARAARRRPARTAARGSGPPRRRASRGSSSGCRAPRPGRSGAWCRDARSAPSRARDVRRRSRKRTRSSPSTRRAFGVAAGVADERRPGASSGAAARPSACPAPTRVSSRMKVAPGAAVAGADIGHGVSLLVSLLTSPWSADGSLERRRSSVGTPPVSTLTRRRRTARNHARARAPIEQRAQHGRGEQRACDVHRRLLSRAGRGVKPLGGHRESRPTPSTMSATPATIRQPSLPRSLGIR